MMGKMYSLAAVKFHGHTIWDDSYRIPLQLHEDMTDAWGVNHVGMYKGLMLIDANVNFIVQPNVHLQ